MKRKISFILALVLMLSTLFGTNIFAKVNLPTVSKSKPLITYTYSSSGKVYAYTTSDLKTKTGGYIACSTDECKIIEIKGNAVKVIYPVSNGTKTAWFSREAFTYRDLAKEAAGSSFTAKTKATTYKWKGKSNTFGSVAKGDKCYLLRGDENSDWVQIIYPVSKGHKMGWVKGSDYADMSGKETKTSTSSSTSTSTLLFPLKGSITRSSSVKTDGYYCDYKTGGSKPIYAPADGTVVYKQAYRSRSGSKKLSSYGNFVEFTSSDEIYKVKCCHLSSFKGVNVTIKSSLSYPCSGSDGTLTLKTKSVKQGDLIGYTGYTGNASGHHLHLEVDKKVNKKYVSVDPKSVFTEWNNLSVFEKPENQKSTQNTTKDSLAEVAKAEIGYQGTDKNGKGTGDYTKYGKFTGTNGQQWCASFVSWCANQAGISTKVIYKTADCDTMEKKSNSYHKWNKNSLKSLKKNDVIFFAKTSNLSNSDHVGIVTAVNTSDKTITIIEGNTGPYYGPDIVKEITYTVNSTNGKITKGYKSGYSFCGYISVN